MQGWADRSARRLSVVAVLALAASYAYLVQPSGDNQNAHYALTRALADGRPYVNEVRGPGPERLQTGDVVEFEGHLFAAKAPGLAAASTPAYVAARAAGMRTTGDPYRVEWVLHLWSIVLPATVMLALAAQLGERVTRGAGAAGAVVVGAASLVLPFAQLLFAHVLAAALAFGAFAFLWRARERAGAAAAGLLAGLAVTVDYPLGLVALALGVYAAATRGRRMQRAAAYTAGLALGVAPALAFNSWAFGDPLHFPYEGWRAPGGEPYPGLFGINVPSLSVGLQLLLVPGGIAPVLAPAVVGLVPMARRGFRAEAFLIGGLAGAYVLYNASSVDPFGGASPGPRYLVPLLPFLAVPVAAALRAIPGVVVALAVGAAAVQALYSVTAPLAAWDGEALDRLRAGSIVETVLEPLGLPARVAILPFFALLAAAALAAVAVARPRVSAREAAAGATALAGWALITWQTPRLADEGVVRELALVALVALAVAAVAAVRAAPRVGRPAPAPADSPPLRR